MTGILIAVVAAVCTVLGLAVYRLRRRQELLARPLPAAWQMMLEEKVPLYRRLPDEFKERLGGLIHLFLADKTFIGCGNLKITDEIKVLIAAQACILVINRTARLYPRLNTIYVYPESFVVDSRDHDGCVVIEGKDVRVGESWQNGPVVLAWDSVTQTQRQTEEGHNVVLHEFAHQLDQEDGEVDGTPMLEDPDSYQSWSEVFMEEFEKLQDTISYGDHAVLDSYGATDPGEFFAVATEAFFENSWRMQSYCPRLYAELTKYYKLDPASWDNNP